MLDFSKLKAAAGSRGGTRGSAGGADGTLPYAPGRYFIGNSRAPQTKPPPRIAEPREVLLCDTGTFSDRSVCTGRFPLHAPALSSWSDGKGCHTFLLTYRLANINSRRLPLKQVPRNPTATRVALRLGSWGVGSGVGYSRDESNITTHNVVTVLYYARVTRLKKTCTQGVRLFTLTLPITRGSLLATYAPQLLEGRAGRAPRSCGVRARWQRARARRPAAPPTRRPDRWIRLGQSSRAAG